MKLVCDVCGKPIDDRADAVSGNGDIRVVNDCGVGLEGSFTLRWTPGFGRVGAVDACVACIRILIVASDVEIRDGVKSAVEARQ